MSTSRKNWRRGSAERRNWRGLPAGTLLPILLAALVILCAPAPEARAQPPATLLWSAQGVENVVCVTPIQDIDGDGGPDVVFESYDAGAPATDHIFAMRGRSSGTGQILWSARPLGGPSNSGGYGDNCLRISPDLNADGFPEVLLGAAWGSRTAFALDGRTGATEWSFDTYSQSPPSPPTSGWIYAMNSLKSDVDGDGVPEVVFCAGSYNDGCYCASGRTGQILWFYQGPDAFFDILSIEDINGDGTRDVIAGVGDSNQRVVALSGRGNGSGGAVVLWTHATGSVWSLARLQDITGDGISEIVVASWDNIVHCLRGNDGTAVWTAPGDYGMRVVALDDVNSDGIQDVAYASFDNAARVYSGIDGALLWRSQVGTLNGGDVWAIDRVDDLTGDGINDVCCGSFDTRVYLMDGVTGQIVWSYVTGSRLYTVRGVPDLNGNGYPDVVAGTQMLSSAGGVCYALEGGSVAAAVGEGEIARGVRISPGAPNPFHASTTWSLQVPEPGRLQVEVFSPQGRKVATPLPLAAAGPGELHVTWDGRDAAGREVASGVYYVRVLLDGRLAGERRSNLVR